LFWFFFGWMFHLYRVFCVILIPWLGPAVATSNPKMKIDEPKTPFTNASLSDAGSSSNGSVPHSPELPTVTFVEVERLAGFDQLEKQYGSGSESSTPRSREFERKRKLHYKAEFHRLDKPLDDISDSNDDEPQDGVLDDDEPLDGVLDVAGEENDEDEADDDDDELENGDGEEDRDGSDGMEKSEEGVRRDMPGNGTMDGDG